MQWPPPRPRPNSDAAHRDHLDPGLAQQGVGVGVSIVGDDHARLESDDIVAVVPLFAFGLPGIAAGLDDPQCLEPEGILHDVEQRLVVRAHLDAAGAVLG